jgi:single-stranded-DNA-specific exonuclease
MSPIEKTWRIHPQDLSLCQKISSQLDIHPVIAQVLLNRQICSISQAKDFLNPPFNNTVNFDPEQLSKAADLIKDTIDKKGKILVYGDYDVDGITSTAIMTSALQQLGAKVEYYIPHRFSEGYGIHASTIDMLISKKIDLLITVDCGISNINEVQQLKQLSNIKVVIMDHHNIPAKIPDADAVINPKFLPENHPLYHLCAAGVVYKFIEFYENNYCSELSAKKFLDLVAIGTIADIVPLIGENRRLVKLGMTQVSYQNRLGIKYLLQSAKFKNENVSVRDVGFTIAPRLNAAGRLEHAGISVDLLLSQKEKEAEFIANKLQKMNEKRQNMGTQIFNESIKDWTKKTTTQDHNAIIMANSNWHAGIIGITASKLVDRFGRPTVLISNNGNMARGSARTIGDVNIYELLKNSQHYFTRFGGHKEAAGFSILPEKISEFIEHFQDHCNDKINRQSLKSNIEIDAHLSTENLSLDLAKELQKINPFGKSNPTPTFYTKELSPIDFRAVGNGSHLKATFIDKTRKLVVDAIGFGLANKIQLLHKPDVELAFNLDINTWQGKESLQLQLLDIK